MKNNEIYTAKSGLRICCDEMKDVETVSVGVFVGSGSRNEEKSNNGISHFLEHMAFKGTKTRNAKQIAEDFENIGGKINAYTSREKTVYYAKVLKKDAEFAVEFLADIVQNSIFDEKELERERGVILQEIAMTNDAPDDIIFDYFQETAYPNQAIGRSILGPISNIEKFSRQDFIQYTNNNYNYSNIALAAAGNIKQEKLEKWGEKYFNNLGTQKVKKPTKAKYVGGKILKEKDLEQVNLILGFDGISYIDDDYYKVKILSSILGGGMSSRLFQSVREVKGLAYNIQAFNMSYQDCGVFAIYAATSQDKVSQLLQASENEIEKICTDISAQELKRAKKQLESSFLMAKESSSSRMQKIGSNILSHNKILDEKDILDKVKNVTKQDILNISNKLFCSNSLKSFAAIGKVEGL